MKKLEKKKVIIDADSLIFEVCEGKFTKSGGFGAEAGSVESDDYKEPLGKYKQRFKALVADVTEEVAVAALGQFKLKGKPKIALSDPDSNFRYDLYPEYKSNRPSGGRSKLFYRLRDWAIKKYGYVKNCEADDICGYYVLQKGYVGCSIDKDLLRGIEGFWFDMYHSRRSLAEVGAKQARDFNLIQNIIGDPVDSIKALPKKVGDPMIPCVLPEGQKRQPFKITEKIATELLDEYGWNDRGVLAIFESRGFGEDEMVLNRRLICMRQYNGKKIKLWKPKVK